MSQENKEEAEVVKVRQEKPDTENQTPAATPAPQTPRLIRVHFHLGKSCRSEAIDQSRSFDMNKAEILNQFGIGAHMKHERERYAEQRKYVLRLRDGGVVENNNVLFQDDHVLIIPREDFLRQQAALKENDVKKRIQDDGDVEMNTDEAGRHRVQVGNEITDSGKKSQVSYKNLSDLKLKNLRNLFSNTEGQPPNSEYKVEGESQSQGGAAHNSTKHETMSLNAQQIKYKSLLKKKCKTVQPDAPDPRNQVQQIDVGQQNMDSSAKWQETDHIIRKIDYDSLELSLYKKQVSDYHDLLEHVNIWAVHLGFLVKLKRPPKLNQDGSKTLRVYCASYKKSKPIYPSTLEDISSVGGRGSLMKQDPQVQSVNASQVSDCHSVKTQSVCGGVKNEGGVRTCNFALTFKADTSTDCWLMYQEYHKEQMMHTHQLDALTYANIREYIGQYTDKVRSLTELKELIYERFGLEYTLNQISYFRGKWTAEAYIMEKNEASLQDDDYNNLIKLLKKNSGDFLEYEFDDNDTANLKFLFYSSAKMKEVYLQSSDIVFINKRFTLNRFKRPIMLWFTVSNSGQSQLIALSMYEREEAFYFNKVAKCFMKQMSEVPPKTIIIERQLKLYQAIQDASPSSKILFCYYHILKTLKTQYAFLEREKPDEFKMLTDLPIIDTVQEFETQLNEVEQFKYKNEYHQLIIQKMATEKQKMTKCFHMEHFTGGISVCQRNEQIKAYLKPVLKKRDCSIAEILKRILSLSTKDFKLSQEFQIVSPKHDQVFQTAHFLARVKELCPSYGYQRVKWNIAKGFRFEIKEDRENDWVITQKASASTNKKTWQIQEFVVKKVRLNRKGVERLGGECPCKESAHTGFPCPHLCLLNYKGKIEWLEINPRWYKAGITVKGPNSSQIATQAADTIISVDPQSSVLENTIAAEKGDAEEEKNSQDSKQESSNTEEIDIKEGKSGIAPIVSASDTDQTCEDDNGQAKKQKQKKSTTNSSQKASQQSSEASQKQDNAVEAAT